MKILLEERKFMHNNRFTRLWALKTPIEISEEKLTADASREHVWDSKGAI